MTWDEKVVNCSETFKQLCVLCKYDTVFHTEYARVAQAKFYKQTLKM